MAVAKLVQPMDPLRAFLDGVSIEVMPRTLSKIDEMTPLMAPGSRVYIAHIEGTPFADMLDAAKRLSLRGSSLMRPNSKPGSRPMRKRPV